MNLSEPKSNQKATIRGTDPFKRLCNHLQPFLLELGKGFTFVGRQYRVPVNNTHYRVDLVFYHRILRCFVLIDLKLEEVQHHDIGQMNLYLGYFATEENADGDNPPIGIILTRNKDELLVEYATYQMNSQKIPTLSSRPRRTPPRTRTHSPSSGQPQISGKRIRKLIAGNESFRTKK